VLREIEILNGENSSSSTSDSAGTWRGSVSFIAVDGKHVENVNESEAEEPQAQ
jgi:hypothetical protein